MVKIIELQPTHLEQVQYLVNQPLRGGRPRMGTPLGVHRFLHGKNPGEYVTDPWVRERKSLFTLKDGRVCGALGAASGWRRDSP